MGDERDRESFAPVAKRLHVGFARMMTEELTRASKEGIPADVFFRGILITLAEFSARIASRLISPNENQKSEEALARSARVRNALLQALGRVINTEAGETLIEEDTDVWH